MLLPRTTTHLANPLSPWPAVLITWGPGGKSVRHAHHCWHLVIGLTGLLHVQAKHLRGSFPALLTNPDAVHAIDAQGAEVVIAFVDPESQTGEQLASVYQEDVTVFDDQVADKLRKILSPILLAQGKDGGKESFQQALQILGVSEETLRLRHPGIRRVLRALREGGGPQEHSMEALAALARLSPGRFMHAFTADVGIPLRHWLRWLKLEHATRAIAGGLPLSDAAYAAGFSDAAHMTRTFREMFGTTPSELRRRSQSVQASQEGPDAS